MFLEQQINIRMISDGTLNYCHIKRGHIFICLLYVNKLIHTILLFKIAWIQIWFRFILISFHFKFHYLRLINIIFIGKISVNIKSVRGL